VGCGWIDVADEGLLRFAEELRDIDGFVPGMLQVIAEDVDEDVRGMLLDLRTDQSSLAELLNERCFRIRSILIQTCYLKGP
jgi:hypothetical protein